MTNIEVAYILCFISGMSALLGTIFIFFKFKNTTKIIIRSLAFASGVMLFVSITDLIPESIHLISEKYFIMPTYIFVILSIIIGIIISYTIDKNIPKISEVNNNALYRVGFISMIGIMIHNIPEGIATFITTSTNVKLGISLAISIALHNIPEGISISIPVYYSTNSKVKAVFFTLVSSISEIIGALITYLFLGSFINNFNLGILFGIIAGIMIHISISEMLPESLKYNQKIITIIWFVIGMMFITVKYLF